MGVLLELGSAELRLGAPAAVDHLREAVGLIREPERLATSVRQLANAYTIAAQGDRAVEALDRAIDVIEPADRELALLLEAELASHAQQASPATRAPAARAAAAPRPPDRRHARRAARAGQPRLRAGPGERDGGRGGRRTSRARLPAGGW